LKTQTTAIAALAAVMTTAYASAIPTSAAAPPTTTESSSQALCSRLGGTVGSDETCQVHDADATSTTEISLPLGYPDTQPVIDFVTHRRDAFDGWVAGTPPGSSSYVLRLLGTNYRSGPPASGTQSLVFDVYSDAGVHPVTTYQAFNYDLGRHVAITFDTLFKAGSQPLDVLNPMVERELTKREAGQSIALGADAYQNFAITDDAVIFFLDQDGPIPHELGPLEITVPRTELASLLA
jgi:Protein of unknown function (DUF3298)